MSVIFNHILTRISEWPTAGLNSLIAESECEGFRFVRRAFDDWHSGTNQFSHEGEALFGVFEHKRILAIGGINRATKDSGRLRRVYVQREERGKGVGKHLVQHILCFAGGYYSRVVLRCDTDAADSFYRALGFAQVHDETQITHVFDLRSMLNQQVAFGHARQPDLPMGAPASPETGRSRPGFSEAVPDSPAIVPSRQ